MLRQERPGRRTPVRKKPKRAHYGTTDLDKAYDEAYKRLKSEMAGVQRKTGVQSLTNSRDGYLHTDRKSHPVGFGNNGLYTHEEQVENPFATYSPGPDDRPMSVDEAYEAAYPRAKQEMEIARQSQNGLSAAKTSSGSRTPTEEFLEPGNKIFARLQTGNGGPGFGADGAGEGSNLQYADSGAFATDSAPESQPATFELSDADRQGVYEQLIKIGVDPTQAGTAVGGMRWTQTEGATAETVNAGVPLPLIGAARVASSLLPIGGMVYEVSRDQSGNISLAKVGDRNSGALLNRAIQGVGVLHSLGGGETSNASGAVTKSSPGSGADVSRSGTRDGLDDVALLGWFDTLSNEQADLTSDAMYRAYQSGTFQYGDIVDKISIYPYGIYGYAGDPRSEDHKRILRQAYQLTQSSHLRPVEAYQEVLSQEAARLQEGRGFATPGLVPPDTEELNRNPGFPIHQPDKGEGILSSPIPEERPVIQTPPSEAQPDTAPQILITPDQSGKRNRIKIYEVLNPAYFYEQDQNGDDVLTDGKYRVLKEKTEDHKGGTERYRSKNAGKSALGQKSVFLSGIDIEVLALDSARAADKNDLWFAAPEDGGGDVEHHAVLYADRPIGVHHESGQLTNGVRVHKTSRNRVHVSPTSPSSDFDPDGPW